MFPCLARLCRVRMATRFPTLVFNSASMGKWPCTWKLHRENRVSLLIFKQRPPLVIVLVGCNLVSCCEFSVVGIAGPADSPTIKEDPPNKTLQHSEGSVERTDRHFPVGRLSVGTEPSEPGHGDVRAEREPGSRPLPPVRRVQSPLPPISASQSLRLYRGGDGDICLKVRRLHCQWTRTQG